MHVWFSAPLKSHTRICAPVVLDNSPLEIGTDSLGGARQEEIVEVVFFAYISDTDYRELQKNGIKIEMWTDMPKSVAQDANTGEWGPVTFSENKRGDSSESKIDIDKSVSDSLVDTASSRQAFHISPASEYGQQSHDEEENTQRDTGNEQHEFKASIFVTVSSQRTYSFTYRLVYAAGWINWLGRFNTNGIVDIVVDPTNALFIEKPGWCYKFPQTRTINTGVTSDSNEHFVVGHVNSTTYSTDNWSCKALTSTGVQTIDMSSLKDVDPSYLLLFIPDTAGRKEMKMKPLLFCTSSVDTLMLLTSEGNLVLQFKDEEEYVERMTDIADSTVLEQALLRIGFFLISASNTSLIIGKWDQAGITCHAYIIPLTNDSTRRYTDTALNYDYLKLIFPTSSAVCLFYKRMSKAKILDILNTNTQNSEVLISADRDGGDFVISPVFDLTKDKSLQIAFVEPMTSPPLLKEPVKTSELLPTPPASPQPYQRAAAKRANANVEKRLDNLIGASGIMEVVSDSEGEADNGNVIASADDTGVSRTTNVKVPVVESVDQRSCTLSKNSMSVVMSWALYAILATGAFLRIWIDLILLIFRRPKHSETAVKNTTLHKEGESEENISSQQKADDTEEAPFINLTSSSKEGVITDELPVDMELPLNIVRIKSPDAESEETRNLLNKTKGLEDFVIVPRVIIQSTTLDGYGLEWETNHTSDFLVKSSILMGGRTIAPTYTITLVASGENVTAEKLDTIDESTALYRITL